MTPDEAIAALAGSFDEVEPLVGGTWQKLDDPAPRACEQPGGQPGIRFNAYRFSEEPVADRQHAFDLVSAHWHSLGYALTSREETVAAPILRLFATTPDGRNLQFSAADAALTLEGLSACVTDPAA
ncbi:MULTISPECIES: hypothetical protein [Subtercola]|uniref:Uncharacterized protein n=1 Tax=Subtercola vilae TaxID=2056433 RepID=A0A4T2CBG4_9MICO|nr:MULTISPECIES: hypothetical protein [Subtercola]MEA9983990.1 hypothetical protein [Subtercola sp. RTI3]TIH40942.1 hypothetical protein D4765_00620 [Subtercola vilae]